MSIIVFDLEWNQPVDGMDSKDRKLQFEILEIGAVKLDDDGKVLDSFNELVRPVVYDKLNWHTRKMLNISMKELENGKLFVDVCKSFLDWCGENPTFCTWGTQDLTELQRNMRYFNMEPLSDGPIPFYNVQYLFSLQIKDEEKVYNLESAVDKIELEKDIPFHRAYSDAYYTAKIFNIVDKKYLSRGKAYDLFHLPGQTKDEINEYNYGQYYYVSKLYNEREELVSNRKIMAINCFKCGKRSLRPKTRWFSGNSKIYYGAAYCSFHGPVVGKLRIKSAENGGYYAEKFLKYSDAEGLKEIKTKKENLKKKAKESGKDNTREQIHSHKKTSRRIL